MSFNKNEMKMNVYKLYNVCNVFNVNKKSI